MDNIDFAERGREICTRNSSTYHKIKKHGNNHGKNRKRFYQVRKGAKRVHINSG